MASPTTSETASPAATQITANCITAVPDKYGNVPITACNSYYNFNPQFAPAVAVATIFGVLTIAHLVLAIAFKKGYCWVIIMGATWETVSFILHALGAHDQQNSGYATSHQLLYLLAPLWINAFAYMTIARMVHYFLPDKTVWRIRGVSLAKYFVWADVLAFLVQAVGGIMATPQAGADVIKIGLNVYMGGMGLQEAFILFFIGLMVVFHRRARTLDAYAGAKRCQDWRPLLYALYGALVAVTVRIIYRIAEFAGGIQPSNPVPFHEEYSYSLDAMPMMVALLLLAIFHPGRYLVGPESEFPRLSRKEKKAAKKEKKEAKNEMKAAKKAGKDVRSIGPSVEDLEMNREGQRDGPPVYYEDSSEDYAMHVREQARS